MEQKMNFYKQFNFKMRIFKSRRILLFLLAFLSVSIDWYSSTECNDNVVCYYDTVSYYKRLQFINHIQNEYLNELKIYQECQELNCTDENEFNKELSSIPNAPGIVNLLQNSPKYLKCSRFYSEVKLPFNTLHIIIDKFSQFHQNNLSLQYEIKPNNSTYNQCYLLPPKSEVQMPRCLKYKEILLEQIRNVEKLTYPISFTQFKEQIANKCELFVYHERFRECDDTSIVLEYHITPNRLNNHSNSIYSILSSLNCDARKLYTIQMLLRTFNYKYVKCKKQRTNYGCSPTYNIYKHLFRNWNFTGLSETVKELREHSVFIEFNTALKRCENIGTLNWNVLDGICCRANKKYNLDSIRLPQDAIQLHFQFLNADLQNCGFSDDMQVKNLIYKNLIYHLLETIKGVIECEIESIRIIQFKWTNSSRNCTITIDPEGNNPQCDVENTIESTILKNMTRSDSTFVQKLIKKAKDKNEVPSPTKLILKTTTKDNSVPTLSRPIYLIFLLLLIAYIPF